MEITNKKAYHDYFIDSSHIAGMVLTGTEVKSLRKGQASFIDSYCTFQDGELILRNVHIAEYDMGTIHNHIPVHDRTLLMQKQELRRLEAKVKEKGYSIIPLRIFFTEKGIAKVEIGLARGKKQYDKRDTLKKKDTERMVKRQLGRS